MKDIEMTLESKVKEIEAYLSDANAEREKLSGRLNEISNGVSQAEHDHKRLMRALSAIRGDDEPSEANIVASGLGLEAHSSKPLTRYH